jgi:hypothetical protein
MLFKAIDQTLYISGIGSIYRAVARLSTAVLLRDDAASANGEISPFDALTFKECLRA